MVSRACRASTAFSDAPCVVGGSPAALVTMDCILPPPVSRTTVVPPFNPGRRIHHVDGLATDADTSGPAMLGDDSQLLSTGAEKESLPLTRTPAASVQCFPVSVVVKNRTISELDPTASLTTGSVPSAPEKDG